MKSNESIKLNMSQILASSLKFFFLGILLLYCQSIKNKRLSLKESVDYIKPDTIVGCESWLSSDYTNSEILPCGYQTNVFRKDQDKNGGGVFISVHESLSAIEIYNNNSN